MGQTYEVKAKSEVKCVDGERTHLIQSTVNDERGDYICMDCGMKVWKGEKELGSYCNTVNS